MLLNETCVRDSKHILLGEDDGEHGCARTEPWAGRRRAAPYQQTLAAAPEAFNDVFFDAGSGSYIDAAAQANASTYGQVSLQTSLALALTMDAPRTAGTYHRWDPCRCDTHSKRR